DPPPPAHKHADDMSVLLWSDGISWLTAAGYWPYDIPGRDESESWPGANAPHVRDESRASIRKARILASGRTGLFSAVDLERRGPGDYLARRQLLHLKPDTWVIVDHVHS